MPAIERLAQVTLEPEDVFGPENWEIISNLPDAGVYETAVEKGDRPTIWYYQTL